MNRALVYSYGYLLAPRGGRFRDTSWHLLSRANKGIDLIIILTLAKLKCRSSHLIISWNSTQFQVFCCCLFYLLLVCFVFYFVLSPLYCVGFIMRVAQIQVFCAVKYC